MAPPTNLRSLDLNLLTVFEAVYEAGSITRAADRLALSQPATSHALSRLRDACRDDLFVRIGQGIAPTHVARRIYPEIKQALDLLRRSIGEARGFDPATSSRHFRIAIAHPMGPLWALAIRDAARAAAPGVSLEFDTRTIPVDAAGKLRSGELDASVDWYPVEGDRFVLRKLFEERVYFVARANHPRIAPGAAVDALRGEQFVRTHYRSGNPPEAIRAIRHALEDLDLDWALELSEFLEVPYVVLQTDLVGFVLRSMLAQNTVAVALQVLAELPPGIGIPIYLVWHETRRTDGGHLWLRDLVAATVSQAAPD